MALEFQAVRVDIRSGKGRRSINFETKAFDSTLVRAHVALAGFRLQYDGGDVDHHMKVVEVDVDRGTIDASGNKLVFNVECSYADKNGDDSYSGYVDVLAIAEVE